MKICIMTDMEGVAGVINSEYYCRPTAQYYELGRELTTLETNAAIEGAMEAGATDFLVVDAHGGGAINPLLLHPAARLLSRRPLRGGYPYEYVQGSEAAFVVGQHAKANTDGGHLAHTGSFNIEDLSINGVSVGELGVLMLAYAAFGVPTVLVAGDAACGAEAKALLPEVETVSVKEGLRVGSARGMMAEEARQFTSAATHVHPTRARGMIRAAAERAVRRRHEIPLYRLEPPYELVSVRRREENEPAKVARVAGDDILTVLRAPRHHVEPLTP